MTRPPGFPSTASILSLDSFDLHGWSRFRAVQLCGGLQFRDNPHGRMIIHSGEAHLEAPKTYELQLEAPA
jgi:hypothetical protein